MKVCPRCFESNDAAAEFCKDCGAPFQGTEGSDQEVYRDLAKANLHRMRGDTKAANDVCLGILRRFPNNPTAHSLLGDVWADQGDLQQAANWYEMAIDLAPDSTADKSKLESIRERIKLKESAEAAQQIGLPDNPNRPWAFLALVALTVVAVGFGAYALGRFGPAKADKLANTIETPVTVAAQQEDKSGQHPIEKQDQSAPKTSATNLPVVPASDDALLKSLQGAGTEGVVYLGVTEDARDHSLYVTVRHSENETSNLTAARAALEVFRALPETSKAILRVADARGIVFMADATAESCKQAEEAIAKGDTLENQSTSILTRVWAPPAPTDVGTGGQNQSSSTEG